MLRIIAVFLMLLVWVNNVSSAPQQILLGHSSAFSGTASDLGTEMRAGLKAAFAQINDNGGINGRMVRLISLDDGYEPDKAVHNSKVLIEEKQVFALVGQVGTPTAKAALPYVIGKKVPFFAPFTGAEFLRSPFSKYVINVRASYFQEMEKLVNYLVDKKGLKRIACFYQNDSYGYDGLKGLRRALEKRGMELVSSASYERNTVAVMGAARDIHNVQPEAVIMVGAYAACAEFVKLSKIKLDSQVVFASVSFVGTESLREALGKYGEGVIVSQVLPNPHRSTLPLVAEYKEAMELYQHDVKVSFTSFEGFVAGRLFGEIARNVRGPMTREAFIKTLEEKRRFNLGGLSFDYSKDDHQGLDDVFLSWIYPEIKCIDNCD